MRVSYSSGYYAPIPHEHIFPMGKFEGLYTYMVEQNMVAPSDVIEPSMVDMGDLVTVHTPNYAQEIMTGKMDRKKHRRLGLP